MAAFTTGPTPTPFDILTCFVADDADFIKF